MDKKKSDLKNKEFNSGFVLGSVIGMMSAILWLLTIQGIYFWHGQNFPLPWNPLELPFLALFLEWVLPAFPSYLKLKNSKLKGFLFGQCGALIVGLCVLFICWIGVI